MITFIGDVFPVSRVDLDIELPGAVVLNLEAPLTHAQRAYPGKINLRGSAKAFTETFKGREVLATLGNNHCMDFYEEGLADTFAVLDAAGIEHCGAGTPEDGYGNPGWLEVGGRRVAVIAYADASCSPVFAVDDHPGAAPMSLDRVTADIASARENGADRVVVCAHWGAEQVHLPDPRVIGLGRGFIDAGADVVIGHHAHCIQSYEFYKGKPVMYGLGNCMFPAHSSPSFYDVDGRPTSVTRSRPALRNRRSIALTWDVANDRYQLRTLYFDGAKLTHGHFSHAGFRLSYADAERYEARYTYAYRWGKLLHTLESFVARPKVPRLSHLRNLTRTLRTSPRS